MKIPQLSQKNSISEKPTPNVPNPYRTKEIVQAHMLSKEYLPSLIDYAWKKVYPNNSVHNN